MSECDWVRPIYLADRDVDVMSQAAKRAVLAHNETWQVNCLLKQEEQ